MVDHLSRDQVHQVWAAHPCPLRAARHRGPHFRPPMTPSTPANCLTASPSQLYVSFQLLDGDRDGKINATDLQKFLSTFNANYTLVELEELIEVSTQGLSSLPPVHSFAERIGTRRSEHRTNARPFAPLADGPFPRALLTLISCGGRTRRATATASLTFPSLSLSSIAWWATRPGCPSRSRRQRSSRSLKSGTLVSDHPHGPNSFITT